tara:strand:+ start:516 stop:1187 length:672 start_codon:yes stop_codon:yes gene_type:complete
MSKKNTLLEENTVRRFMKLASIGGLANDYVAKRSNLNEMGGMYDEDLYEAEEDEDPTVGMEPEGEGDDLGGEEPAMDEPDMGDPDMGEPDMGGEEDAEMDMGMGGEEDAGGGDAATSIVDATVTGLEKGLKAAGLLGKDDSLTTSDGAEEPMDDLGAEEEPGLEDPMAGDEEEGAMALDPEGADAGEEGPLPPEDEEGELQERALSEIARRVAVRLLQRRSRK